MWIKLPIILSIIILSENVEENKTAKGDTGNIFLIPTNKQHVQLNITYFSMCCTGIWHQITVDINTAKHTDHAEKFKLSDWLE